MNQIAATIDPSNSALHFIDKRIADDKYRGSWSSQHNRYTMEQVVSILNIFNRVCPNKELMQIRTADISRRPHNISGEENYAKFCNEAKTISGIGTQDAMRKNLFVDFHRMGLIERYDSNKMPTDPFSRKSVKYVSLTEQGLKLIESKNLLDQYFIFSRAIDTLLGGYINILLSILRDSEYCIDKITIYDFMFFVSAVDTETSFSIDIDECVNLIREVRKLSPIQRKSVIEKLKETLRPENYIGSKINQRDFHNWQNKAEQVFKILNQTVYFEVQGEILVLKKGPNSYSDDDDTKRLDRSKNEKYQYFVNHNVSKVSGFELHHVVPLAWSESKHHFKLLDTWKNMVYIDAFSHAKITQNRNRNIVMQRDGDNLTLSDYDSNVVYLNNLDNIVYDLSKQDMMLQHNNELRKTLK